MRKILPFQIVLILLLTTAVGCSRGREAEDRNRGDAGSPLPQQAAPEVIELGEGQPPAAPASPPPAPAETPPQPAVSPPQLPVLPAAEDLGFSASAAPVYDYELGELDLRVPDSFRLLIASLGGALPEQAAAEEWLSHLERQTADFSSGTYRLRMGAGRREEGFLVAPVKIIADNQLILGSIRGRLNGDGNYLVEDLAVEELIGEPFPGMVMPPPVRRE